jgi:hypothetical protein
MKAPIASGAGFLPATGERSRGATTPGDTEVSAGRAGQARANTVQAAGKANDTFKGWPLACARNRFTPFRFFAVSRDSGDRAQRAEGLSNKRNA